jgi:Na+-transporting NADH:ubiquinone oxidoreductase subunit A
MTKAITIRKGLDIKLAGEAERVIVQVQPEFFAVKPTDFHGVLPKLLVGEGDKVLAGTPLFYDKYNERVRFTSPVSGEVHAIRRGPKRLLEEIVIRSDHGFTSVAASVPDLAMATPAQITDLMLELGIWPAIRQRPYNVIATPGVQPRDVHISAFDSAPLAPDYDFLIANRGHEFQLGLDVIARLAGAPVYLNIHEVKTKAREFLNATGVHINRFKGPHPAGNVGIQIHHIKPVNKGEVIWVINPMDVAMIGKLFLEKQYSTERVFALAGSEVRTPKYFRTHAGASVSVITSGQTEGNNLRYISGNVLTGNKITAEGFAGFYDHLITVIPEGDYYEFVGWAKPGFKAFTNSNTFLSRLFYRKPFRLDTNLHGGERAFVMTGQYEKVFPMDIYPVQLIKAIMVNDIDLMENLGIYEVDEEDFALCEVVCTSKIEVQSFIREGLDLIRKEMS